MWLMQPTLSLVTGLRELTLRRSPTYMGPPLFLLFHLAIPPQALVRVPLFKDFVTLMGPSDTSISSSYSDDSMSDIYIRRVNALSGRSYAQLTVPASPWKVIGFPFIVSIPRLQARLIFGL